MENHFFVLLLNNLYINWLYCHTLLVLCTISRSHSYSLKVHFDFEDVDKSAKFSFTVLEEFQFESLLCSGL